jgi:hypothetical protein
LLPFFPTFSFTSFSVFPCYFFHCHP